MHCILKQIKENICLYLHIFRIEINLNILITINYLLKLRYFATIKFLAMFFYVYY